MIRRGDIRWFRFEAPDKRRPVLVLGKSDILPSLSQIPVIPLSTQTRGLPWEVRLTSADGVPAECVLKPEWNRIIDLTVLEDWQEGGTMVIPGHGRVADEADVVEYRDMAAKVVDAAQESFLWDLDANLGVKPAFSCCVRVC